MAQHFLLSSKARTLQICSAGLSDDEVEANIALLSAAPDLLAALREAWELLPDRPPHDPVHCQYDKIRAALAKASGR